MAEEIYLFPSSDLVRLKFPPFFLSREPPFKKGDKKKRKGEKDKKDKFLSFFRRRRKKVSRSNTRGWSKIEAEGKILTFGLRKKNSLKIFFFFLKKNFSFDCFLLRVIYTCSACRIPGMIIRPAN
jgi:hypothetical protein